jgi:hypothetical protein
MSQPRKNNCENDPAEKIEDGSWRDDQALRKYYYDDACGYEAFDPESEPDEEDDDESGEIA